MAGDPARRVARIRKWAELTERYGSDEEAWYAIKSSPEWELTYQLYPDYMLDEGRRALVLDLMIGAAVEPQSSARDVIEPARSPLRGTKGRRASAPYPRRLFNAIARNLTAGEDKREIARATGISRKRIDKIELWLNPPRGGAVYELESAPLDENAVVLRRLK